MNRKQRTEALRERAEARTEVEAIKKKTWRQIATVIIAYAVGHGIGILGAFVGAPFALTLIFAFVTGMGIGAVSNKMELIKLLKPLKKALADSDMQNDNLISVVKKLNQRGVRDENGEELRARVIATNLRKLMSPPKLSVGEIMKLPLSEINDIMENTPLDYIKKSFKSMLGAVGIGDTEEAITEIDEVAEAMEKKDPALAYKLDQVVAALEGKDLSSVQDYYDDLYPPDFVKDMSYQKRKTQNPKVGK